MVHPSVLLCSAASLLFGSAPMATSQPVKPEISLKLAAAKAAASSQVKGTVSIEIPEGWHGYQNPPTKDYQIPIAVTAADQSTKIVKVTYPAGVSETAAGEQTMVYSGLVKIPVVFKVGDKPGTQKLKVSVRYQLCDSGSCLPPTTETITASIKVVKKAAGAGH